jgi:hypothetical protein
MLAVGSVLKVVNNVSNMIFDLFFMIQSRFSQCLFGVGFLQS